MKGINKMKVLSIKEPWATLIKDNVKKIETRSWKTNYRGELFIHTSKSKISKKIKSNLDIMNLLKSDLSYGKIICKCRIVDCIYMTEEFINNLKKNNYQEYICGNYKVGRYAWILEDIQTIEPIDANGKLGIWNL